MVEKNKKVKEEVQNSKNDLKEKILIKENKTKNNDSLYMFVGILVVLILLGLFLFQGKIVKLKTNKVQKTNNSVERGKIETNIERDVLLKEVQRLEVSLKSLQIQVKNNENYIENIEAKLNNLEVRIEEISINPQKVELIKVAMSIKKNIDNGVNYSSNLSVLKSLSKDNKTVLNQINILEKYRNDIITEKIINKTFKEELKFFVNGNNKLKNEKNGEISKFFSNFITVRKIKNPEENSLDEYVITIENDISSKNYDSALVNIEKNKNDLTYFSNTEKNLKSYIVLNKSIDEIINYLVSE